MGWAHFWLKCLAASVNPAFAAADVTAWLTQVVPAAIAAIGYSVTSDIPWWAVPLTFLLARTFLVAPYQMWKQLHSEASKKDEELDYLRGAWDRSDRNLIPIREAIEMVAANLADTWPRGIDQEEKHWRAATKLREIGLENQGVIWGYEAVEPPDVFKSHKVQIPPMFWLKNHIEPEYVFARTSVPDSPVVHTSEDEEFELDRERQPIFGDLRISKKTLAAMCPPPKA